MRTLDDLRATFEREAGTSDGFGITEAAQAGAARIRRRRRVLAAAAVTVLVGVVAAAVPIAVTRMRGADPLPATPAPYRAPSEITLSVQPTSAFFVLSHGTDSTRQFLTVRNRNTSAKDFGGTVSAYDPGTFDPAGLKRGERVTVAGHSAYLVPTAQKFSSDPQLGWQDDSGVWVTISETVNRAAVLRLAGTVRLGPPRQVTAPMRFGWAPGGLPLSYARNSDETGGIRGYQLSSYVGFAADRPPAPDTARPPMGAESGMALNAMAVPKTSMSWTEVVAPVGAPPGRFPTPKWETIGGQRAWYLVDNAKPGIFPAGPGAHLFIETDTCGVTLAVTDLAVIDYAELVRTVTGMTFSSCTDATTWQPAVS